MKRLSLAVMALFMMVGLTMAQGPRGGKRDMDPQKHAERMTEHMAKEFGLNDTQKQELLDVNLAMAEKMGEKPVAGAHMHLGKKGHPGKSACTCSEGECACKNCKACGEAKVAGDSKEKKADRPERKERAERRERPERPEISKEDMEKRVQEMKEARDRYNGELQKIMTQEQYQAYSKKQAERIEKMKEHAGKRKENRKS